jgi:psiF repeat
MNMNLVLTLAVLSVLCLAGMPCAQAAAPSSTTSQTAPAAPPVSAAQLAQQNRMKICAKQYQAQTTPKTQYRTFMSSCMKNTPGTVSLLSPEQEKMKTCNQNATTQKLTGDARTTFMKTCLGK